MHLVLPFAAGASDAGAQALHGLRLPQLERLLAGLQSSAAADGDAHSLSLPHERLLAALHGWTGGDGRWPFAAAQARGDGLPVDEREDGEQGWGLLTPTNWQVGREQIVLRDPDELGLDEAESRALLQAVRPLFDSEGWSLQWGAPLRWYARHASLRGLATASLERVIGRAIDPWLPDRQAARHVRRLQSEVQMLLHTHPLNDARETRGALPVNSFWLSGTGVTQPLSDAPSLPAIDMRLRAPLLAEDWTAWVEAWQALDAGPIAELAARAQRGGPVSLSLCGERRARRFETVQRSAWARLTQRWRRVAAESVLGSL